MPGPTDNYIGNLGTGGETYGSDSIGSVHFPRFKVVWGVDGSAVDASAANPLPVSGTFWQATQPVSGTVNVNVISGFATEATLAARIPVNGQALMAASVPVTIASNQSALPVTLGANQSVNVAQINGVAPTMGTGISGTGVQRVTLATDIALPTGANVIGALTANQSVNCAQMNGVAVTMGNGVAGTGVQRVAIASDNTAFNVTTTPSASATTFSASVTAVAAATLATDIFTLYGSASKTVRVTGILVSGVQTTASQANVLVIKRSAVNTGGTSSAPTRVPYDSTNAAATATVLSYTANPTGLGTSLGTLSTRRLFVPGAATASDAQGLEIKFGEAQQQMVTLRGTAEGIAINLNGVTLAGNNFNITIEWTES